MPAEQVYNLVATNMSSISIITVNYNNADGLRQTMNSVFAQTHLPAEYILIDGGSGDGSLEIIQQHAQQLTYWCSEKDAGVYDAMNKGIGQATGDYLMFLNSGDCFCDNSVLEKATKKIESLPGAAVYYGDIYIVNDPSSSDKEHYWQHPEQLDLNFLRKETINHQASLIKASVFKEFGPYPLHYKMASDYWLWLTALLHDKRFTHLGFPMIKYDLRGQSSANRKEYLTEKAAIWKTMIAESIDKLVIENDYYRQLTAYKMIKAVIRINKKFQSLKGFK